MGRLHIYLSDELLTRVDALRGPEPRSSFIRRAVESTVLGNRALPSVPMEPSVQELEPPRPKPPEPETPLPKIARRHWQ